MKYRVLGLIAALVSTLLAPVIARADVTEFTFTGVVRDVQGNLLQNVLISDGKGRSALTNAVGRYNLYIESDYVRYSLTASRADVNSVTTAFNSAPFPSSPATPRTVTLDFLNMTYKATGRVVNSAVSAQTGATTLELVVTGTAIAPSSGNETTTGKSCVNAKDSRTTLTHRAAYLGSEQGSATHTVTSAANGKPTTATVVDYTYQTHTWKLDIAVAQSATEGPFTLTFAVLDCVDGRLLVPTANLAPANGVVNYLIDSTSPQIYDAKPTGWQSSSDLTVDIGIAELSALKASNISLTVDGNSVPVALAATGEPDPTEDPFGWVDWTGEQEGEHVGSKDVVCHDAGMYCPEPSVTATYSNGSHRLVYRPVGGFSAAEHTIAVSATDAAGNTASSSFTFNIDGSAPVLSNQSPTGEVTSSTPLISVDVSEVGPSGINPGSVTMYISAGSEQTQMSRPAATYSGNASGGTVSYQVPDAEANCFDTEPLINGEDPLDDVPPVCGPETGGARVGEGPLSPGTYTVTVIVRDEAGNEASLTWSFTVV